MHIHQIRRVKVVEEKFEVKISKQDYESFMKSWLTVYQLSQKFPAFSENSIRALIYASKPRLRAKSKNGEEYVPGNGLAHAIRKVGRRVLIDECAFAEWINSQSAS